MVETTESRHRAGAKIGTSVPPKKVCAYCGKPWPCPDAPASLRSTSRDSEWTCGHCGWIGPTEQSVNDHQDGAHGEPEPPTGAELTGYDSFHEEHGPWCRPCRFAEPSRDSEVREAIEALPAINDWINRDAVRAILDRSASASEVAPTPYPRSVAVDENGIPSIVTHYPASEAAPVVGLDVEALARAIDSHEKGIATRFPGPTEVSRQKAQALAAVYARLTQTRTLGEAKPWRSPSPEPPPVGSFDPDDLS